MAHGRREASGRGFRALTLVAVALLVGAVFAATPTLVQADQTRQEITGGLTAPAGMLVDPAGRIWVSDARDGFCRVTESASSTPGSIETATCLGGTLSSSQPGPKLAGAPALADPTVDAANSGDEMALIPDAAAGSAELTRAVWQPAAGTFSYHGKLSLVGGDLRPTAVAVGPDGFGYVVFIRSKMVLRIVDPTGEQPELSTVAFTSSLPSRAIAIGAANAAGRVRVYVAEANRLTSFVAPKEGVLSADSPAASYAVGKSSALSFDAATGLLYSGTAQATSAGQDGITRVDTASGAITENWATGFTRIGVIGARNGQLITGDDPGLLSQPPATAKGALYAFAAAPRIVTGPTRADGTLAPDPSITNSQTPTFTVAVEGGEALQCVFDPTGADSHWSDCTGGSFTANPALADGKHTFAVRIGATGVPVQASFTVDTVPPTVSAAPPAGEYPSGQKVTLTANEAAQIFYTVDGTPPTSSSTSYTKPITLSAPLTLSYIGIDAAGNTSAPASQAYTVKPNTTRPPHDFNGDGHPDVLAKSAGGLLWLYPGDGTGGWLGGPSQVGSGWNSMSAIVAPGDFNGDGNPDVLARNGNGVLWLYPGDGAGGWGARSQVGSGWNSMSAILGPGDFNGDGHSDVLARNGNGVLWLYPGDGTGGWLGRSQVGSGWNSMSVIL
ncbi:MAG: FG-GAP-like repeat-containing protein [Microbacteriaceae bacterium]